MGPRWQLNLGSLFFFGVAQLIDCRRLSGSKLFVLKSRVCKDPQRVAFFSWSYPRSSTLLGWVGGIEDPAQLLAIAAEMVAHLSASLRCRWTSAGRSPATSFGPLVSRPLVAEGMISGTQAVRAFF